MLDGSEKSSSKDVEGYQENLEKKGKIFLISVSLTHNQFWANKDSEGRYNIKKKLLQWN